MEHKNDKHPEGCKCWCCQGHDWGHCCGAWLRGGKHRIIAIIIFKLIIIFCTLAIVFSVGVKVGEFKAEMKGNYYYQDFHGQHMLWDRGGYTDCRSYPVPIYGGGIPQCSDSAGVLPSDAVIPEAAY